MKYILIILSLLLAGLSSCKDKIEKARPEFIGCWFVDSHGSNGSSIHLSIDESSSAYFRVNDFDNYNDYHSRGEARANDNKLTIGGTKYFLIIEYPHPLDTTIEKNLVLDPDDNIYKIANWKMVLDGLHGSINCNVGECAFYKADY